MAPLTDHIPSLRRYARALTGDAWMADDLVQDTLERACTKWRLWAVGSDLRAWLFTLMHNIFINQVRRSVRQAAAGATVNVDDVEHEMAAPEAGTAQSLDLQRCLLRLPEDQRVVLLLVSLEDLSYDEVAKITGVPVGTVMSRLSRARSRLRELMDAPAMPATPATPAETGAPPQLRRLK
ncbi:MULTISPECIES: RNA polymerase sigma factor [unclassified Polaromonas]|uniref:RNA polymerase sigma factor n=1 Tax=unclassified Polaromonas TaxID=2638319 RepID=UPI000F0748DC|nr:MULTISPECIES: RNA polymerase sigma factor [unclassified Polaromonas]AYQ29464.1 RNA polymerase sigma factor [Polaromonas sp. SP1]QGJ19421.1 sigma-70 family RNA polymerase sigma factor [Polaromonas sp. Pch-P]